MNKKIHSVVNSKVRFKLKEIIPKVYHIEFSKQVDVTSSLLRFQEHYESPKFRGKIFSLDEYIAWYRTTRKKGRFTYFTDWSGYNFPSKVLKPFKDGRFGPLSLREKAILESLDLKDNFYVIGTFKSGKKKDDFMIKKHEIAHALFYLDKNYRKSVLKVLETVDKKPIFKFLKNAGYHPGVFLDEAHAFLLVDSKELKEDGIKLAPYRKTIKDLEKLFNQAIKESQS